jgi:hypothetical protein
MTGFKGAPEMPAMTSQLRWSEGRREVPPPRRPGACDDRKGPRDASDNQAACDDRKAGVRCRRRPRQARGAHDDHSRGGTSPSRPGGLSWWDGEPVVAWVVGLSRPGTLEARDSRGRVRGLGGGTGSPSRPVTLVVGRARRGLAVETESPSRPGTLVGTLSNFGDPLVVVVEARHPMVRLESLSKPVRILVVPRCSREPVEAENPRGTTESPVQLRDPVVRQPRNPRGSGPHVCFCVFPVFHVGLISGIRHNWSHRCILYSPASLVDNEGEECLVQKVLSRNIDKTGNGKRETGKNVVSFLSCITYTAAVWCFESHRGGGPGDPDARTGS